MGYKWGAKSENVFFSSFLGCPVRWCPVQRPEGRASGFVKVRGQSWRVPEPLSCLLTGGTLGGRLT